MHKTSAWPLAAAYAVLVVYASLYPFSGWRNQEIAPWEFLFAGWPKYWTAFDLAGTGKASTSSFLAAIAMADKMTSGTA